MDTGTVGTVVEEVGKLALGKMATSAGTKFVDKAWDNASKWLKEKFRGHNKEVLERATKNSESFMEKTGKQVQIIVKNSQKLTCYCPDYE